MWRDKSGYRKQSMQYVPCHDHDVKETSAVQRCELDLACWNGEEHFHRAVRIYRIFTSLSRFAVTALASQRKCTQLLVGVSQESKSPTVRHLEQKT